MLANQGDGAGGKLRVSIGDEHYLCRTFFIQQQNGATGEPSIALYLHRDTSFTDAINDIAAEYHLSDREQQALRGIAIGLSAKEMADQMDISPNTVKSFLRIVMIKLGVGTRAGILAGCLNTGSTTMGCAPSALHATSLKYPHMDESSKSSPEPQESVTQCIITLRLWNSP